MKKYEPFIDQKLLEAQHAAEECIEDFQENPKEALSRRVEAVKKSQIVTKAVEVMTSPPRSPSKILNTSR